MRAAILLMCLALGACAATGGKLPGEQPAPDGAAASSALPPAAPPAASPTAATAPASAQPAGARPAPQTQPVQAQPAPPAEVSADTVTQARVDCWAKVEHQKGLRNIDKRIEFVDKCIDDRLKGKSQ